MFIPSVENWIYIQDAPATININVQGWAKEWSLGLQFFLPVCCVTGCVATKLNKKSLNLGTTL